MGGELKLILPSWPPKRNWIDAMQLMATHKIWHANGGWPDKRETSGGTLLAGTLKRPGYCVLPHIFGENW